MEDKVILLVEDETDVMLANQEYLEKRGLTVVMAETLQEARVELESRKIDLILLDVNMPVNGEVNLHVYGD